MNLKKRVARLEKILMPVKHLQESKKCGNYSSEQVKLDLTKEQRFRLREFWEALEIRAYQYRDEQIRNGTYEPVQFPLNEEQKKKLHENIDKIMENIKRRSESDTDSQK